MYGEYQLILDVVDTECCCHDNASKLWGKISVRYKLRYSTQSVWGVSAILVYPNTKSVFCSENTADIFSLQKEFFTGFLCFEKEYFRGRFSFLCVKEELNVWKCLLVANYSCHILHQKEMGVTRDIIILYYAHNRMFFLLFKFVVYLWYDTCLLFKCTFGSKHNTLQNDTGNGHMGNGMKISPVDA